jgi:hypothetical protein
MRAMREPTGVIAGLTALVLWVVAAVLGYVGIGGVIADQIEGIDPSQIVRWPAALAVVTLVAALAATVVWARRLWRLPSSPVGLGRRRFLVGAGATVGGLAGVTAAVFGRISGWALVTAQSM